METIGEPLKLLLSLVLGGLIGLEREMNEKTPRKDRKPIAIVGVRSFSLIGALGAISGMIYAVNPFFAILSGILFAALVLIFYILDTKLTRATGITTELALIYSYFLGVLIALEVFSIQLTLAVSIVLILLLSKKDTIRSFVEDIRATEINAFLSFAIIAVVILPFLPNESFALSDIRAVDRVVENLNLAAERIGAIEIINPFNIWLIVALITGIDLLGHLLERTLGKKKGWILASIAGGFISSTATTQSLAQQSTKSKRINHLVSAALIANLASLFSILLLLAAIDIQFLIQAFPVIMLTMLGAIIVTVYFLRRQDSSRSKREADINVGKHEIINIGSALKFAIIFLAVNILSKITLEFYGSGGFLLTTAIGAFVGLTAVMINTAELAGRVVDLRLAVFAFILANAVNLIAKSAYSYLQGSKEFAQKLLLSFLVIIGVSLLGLFFV